MKNLLKKTVSVILSLLLVFGTLSVASFAADGHDPIIVVSGMGAFPLYCVDESGEETQVWAPSGEIIKNTVVSVLKKSVTLGGFVNGLLDALYDDLFSYIACDEKGESINEIKVPFFPESVSNYPDDFENSENTEDEVGIIKTFCRQYGADNVYFFNYDWRMSPLDDADGLNDFINNVKAEKGCETVTLVPCSMGGTVTNAYLYKYGHSNVSKIIYSMVASKGLDMVGDMFNRNISINTDTLLEYFFSFEMGTVLVQALISAAQAGMSYSKLGTTLDALIAKLLAKINDRAYDELLSRTFANFAGIWAFVGEDYFDGAKAAMFGGNMNPTLETKVDEYYNNVLSKAENLMGAAQDDGVDIYIIASYGFVGAPVTQYALEQSDCLIETKNEAFGATVAKYGETLGDNYIAAGTNCADESHAHLSTDGVIDATTGAFPETTWFVKNNRHVGMNCETDCAGLMVFLAEMKGATVSSDESFPQFVELNPVTGKFRSLTGSEVEKLPTVLRSFSRLIEMAKAFIDTIIKLLTK